MSFFSYTFKNALLLPIILIRNYYKQKSNLDQIFNLIVKLLNKILSYFVLNLILVYF